jgi:hypothetical protein
VRNGFTLDRSIAVLRGHEYGTAFPAPVFELIFEPEQTLRGRATDRFAPCAAIQSFES